MAFSPCVVGGSLWSKVRAELKGSWKKSLEKMEPYPRAQTLFLVISARKPYQTVHCTPPSASPLYLYQDFTSVCPCTNYSHTKPCPPAVNAAFLSFKKDTLFCRLCLVTLTYQNFSPLLREVYIYK